MEDERLAVYEREREELAATIIKAVQGQYIGKPPPLLTGWQERAVSAVLAAGWLPPAAVQERVDDVSAENEQLRAEIARLQDAAANALANQTALKGMTVDEGALVLELGPPRELVIAWVDAARKMLGDAENYSETRIDFPRESASMEVKAAGEFERYVFTVQRAGKITPHEARRAAEDLVEQCREILHSIWLYVDWKYVTKQLTTEQKDLWADAVDAGGDQSESGPKAMRWWREDFAICEEPVCDGELECGDYADPVTKRCKAHTAQDGEQHG